MAEFNDRRSSKLVDAVDLQAGHEINIASNSKSGVRKVTVEQVHLPSPTSPYGRLNSAGEWGPSYRPDTRVQVMHSGGKHSWFTADSRVRVHNA